MTSRGDTTFTIGGLPDPIPLALNVWRGHPRWFDALDAGGSRISSARFHRAPDRYPETDTWPALYASLELTTSLAEIMRSREPQGARDIRLTEIAVELAVVADRGDLEALGIDRERLFADWDFTLAHALAKQVRADGVEALLVPSASGLGDNLIVFPDRLRPTSTLTVVRSVDPKLIKDPR